MNILSDKKQCYGCGACSNICPTNAISMTEDEEGFLFPHVDNKKCIQCGKCKSVCPRLNVNYHNSSNPKTYGIVASDEIRQRSSSGGAAMLLSQWCISEGGVVCGATLNENLVSVSHIIVSDKINLEKLQKTKYIQSDINDTYLQIRAFLSEEKLVLFIGTPCQVAGLYSFLGNMKNSEKLVTMDLVCHGVPSPKAWEIFLKSDVRFDDIKEVDFRTKESGGWKGRYDTLITYKDETKKIIKFEENKFAKAFLDNNILRYSCYSCQYSHIPRQGDFTIGDFWGIGKEHPEMDDRNGTSLLLLNNEKAGNIFNKAILPKVKKHCETTFDVAYLRNTNLMKNSWIGGKRNQYLKVLSESGSYEMANNSKKRSPIYDVGIISWFYSSNYGAVLTSFALYRAIQNMGYRAILIDKPSRYNGTEYPINHFNASRRFINRYCKTTNRFNLDDQNDVIKLNNVCKIFCTGSDQLWRYDLIKDMYPYYFLEFTNKTKISYSTSFGGSAFSAPDDVSEDVKMYLREFDAVSVREINGVSICKDQFNVNAKHVLDPVFLLEESDYAEIAQTSKIKKRDYIFAYMLNYSETKDRLLQEVAKILGYELVFVNYVTNKPWTIEVQKVEIEDFLSLIKNSKYVITDSFHATCFSIIFQIPFISTCDGRAGKDRFTSLLKKVKLLDRLLKDFSKILECRELYSEPDFSAAEIYLKRERIKSLDYLITAIESENKKKEKCLINGGVPMNIHIQCKGQKNERFTDIVLTEEMKLSIKKSTNRQYTISFDWNCTSDGGRFKFQLLGSPWDDICEYIDINPENMVGHYQRKFIISREACENESGKLQLRCDNINGTLEICNITITK